MQNNLTEDRGQSLFQTSTHTAHHWRPGFYFPSSNFKVTYFSIKKLKKKKEDFNPDSSQTVVMDPIPPSLNSKDQILPDIHYSTTNHTYHDNKYPNQDLYNEALALKQVKPLPSYKVNYMFDVIEKVKI